MKPSDQYRAIFTRKSIRKYQPSPLPQATLAHVGGLLGEATRLARDIRTELRIMGQSDLKGLLQVKAPHWIAAFSEEKPGYLANVGFMLEQVVLALTAEGIGCCWQGWPKPTRELRGNRALSFVIAVAFGAPRERLYRESIGEFKRKALGQIRTAASFDDLIEPARLAPFGTSESWFFTADPGALHVHCPRPGLLTPAKVERMNQVNAGIAFSHCWVAAIHLRSPVELSILPDARDIAPEGFDYVASMKVGGERRP